jgi:Photosynthesis system II assembly factor YCF48/Putative zinc-finger
VVRPGMAFGVHKVEAKGRSKIEIEMQDVPQFVLNRLQAKPVAGSHPDADLLTAFAERSLAGRERAVVVEHLVACADCRDVVAIALTATEAIAPASAATPRIGWLSSPILRWSALAAGILVVASAGVREYSHRNQQQAAASNRMQSEIALPRTLNQSLPALNPPSSTEAMVPQTMVPQTRMRKKESLATTSQRVVKHEAPAEVAGAGQSAQQQTTTAASQQTKIGAASEKVEVQSEAGQINTESAAPTENQVVAQNQTNLPLNGRNFTDLNIVKAKDPVPSQSAVIAVTATPPPLQSLQSVAVRPLPQWSVTPAGALQRSFDGGNTWEDVNPARSTASTGSRGAMANAARADATSSDQGKENQNAKRALDLAPAFRAVAATGFEVWAGGVGGVLYHTSDAGNLWTRVFPAAGGAASTGDIVGIHFTDPQHGEVSTSTGELWSTSDNGQTWKKQR